MLGFFVLFFFLVKKDILIVWFELLLNNCKYLGFFGGVWVLLERFEKLLLFVIVF